MLYLLPVLIMLCLLNIMGLRLLSEKAGGNPPSIQIYEFFGYVYQQGKVTGNWLLISLIYLQVALLVIAFVVVMV